MDPIQQRLQAVYQKKSESDIDRKLKSVSTSVLDQRIAFHDASKVPTCPNSQLKGKYLFMKPSTNMQSVTPVTPSKKDLKSGNNNAIESSLIHEDDSRFESGNGEQVNHPTKFDKERQMEELHAVRSGSPLSRKCGSRSPSLEQSVSRSLHSRRSESRSPHQSRSTGNSTSSRKSRSKTPHLRKSRSRSPHSGRSGSRSPYQSRAIGNSTCSRKSKSRSPHVRKSWGTSPKPRRSGSRSPHQSKSMSKSPHLRKSRSRSPYAVTSRSRSPSKSRSNSPHHRKPGSRSPDSRKSSSRSPHLSECRSRSPNSRKSGCDILSSSRLGSPTPGPSTARDCSDDENALSEKQIRKKKFGIQSLDGLPRFLQRDRRLGRSPSREKENSRVPLSPSDVKRKKTWTPDIPNIQTDFLENVVIPPSRKVAPAAKNKQGEEKKSVVRTGKAKKKTKHLTPSDSDSETEVIRKHGTSTRPLAKAKNVKVENTSDESSSEEEEKFEWVDFTEYLPDSFDNLTFYPSDEEVVRLGLSIPEAFTQTEDGDNMPRPNTVLFPEHRLDYSWKFPEGGCGLVNRGNTCFVNAALQCLTYCPPFVNYLLSGQHTRECRMMQKDKCILCSFTRYLQESLRVNKHNIVPIWFLNNLYSVAKHFSLGRQEDSHEYLRLSLEQMQKVCLVGHNQLDRYSKETTVVNQIFGGFLRSQVVCLKCKAKSNTYDPFLDISLDIRTCNTLERAFEIFVRPEKLDIDNAYRCANCKQKVEALKRFTIHKPPNILTIQLKRFQATHDDKFGGTFRGVKINKAVKFPPRLNIRGYMSVRNGPPELYTLYALLFHEGHSANSGHYTCTVKSGTKWFHISDGTKNRTSLHTVNLQDVYVLFYMREDKQHNGIIQNPTLKTEEQKSKEDKAAQRQPSFTSTPSTSGLQKPPTSGTPSGGHKFIGPVKPKIIHTNQFQFKPVKTSINPASAQGSDIGVPVKRKELNETPQKPDAIKAPISADRNKVAFDIKTPGKAHQSTFNSNANATAKQMTKFPSEPILGSAKPRIVMQIKNGKATTIERSPDGQNKILSDDEEVMAKMKENKSHKKFRKSLLVPYGSESSSESDTGGNKDIRSKIKKERKENGDSVVFDTRLNATTSVPGNHHLIKSISNHSNTNESVKHKEKTEAWTVIDVTEPVITNGSIHNEKHAKFAHSVQAEKPVKSENVCNGSHSNLNGNHVYMKHPNGGIHIYDSEPTDNKIEEKHPVSHVAGKKRKLNEDGRIDIINGEFHVESDKKPLLNLVENGHGEKNYIDSEEYSLLKKAKKHKKHKKDKHRHKEYKYETLVNESDHSHHSEHHVKKHKKKKRKQKDRDYDIEEEHSYKKRQYEEPCETKAHKHHHHSEAVEERVYKRQRNESESGSSTEFEWVERKINPPVKMSKSAAW